MHRQAKSTHTYPAERGPEQTIHVAVAVCGAGREEMQPGGCLVGASQLPMAEEVRGHVSPCRLGAVGSMLQPAWEA